MVVPVFRKQKISGQTQNEFLPPVHWLKLCTEATANGKMTKEQGIWNQGLVSPQCLPHTIWGDTLRNKETVFPWWHSG